jgi:hypothetical protein
MKQPEEDRPPNSEVSFQLSYRALVAIMLFVALMVGAVSPEVVTSAFSGAFGR